MGAVMWVSLLESEVHGSFSGVILAMFIPMRDPENPDNSPLRTMEHELQPLVAFLILPTFAF
ncbi:MAG: Na+/H+ antiporter NhaA [Desulfuromusa sp.]|nr:Na+/H+ antiporter NhaA [Desulfuromusa sp.]